MIARTDLRRSRSTVSMPRRLLGVVLFVVAGGLLGEALLAVLSHGASDWFWLRLGGSWVVVGWALTTDVTNLADGKTVEEALRDLERSKRSLRFRDIVIKPREQRPALRPVAWFCWMAAGGLFTMSASWIQDPAQQVAILAMTLVGSLALLALGFERDARARDEPPLWYRLRRTRHGQ